MTPQKVNLAYFTATSTTAKVVSAIASGIDGEQHTINLATPTTNTIASDELVIFGVPVFSGRVAPIAKKGIEMIRGNNTPAIIVCVYGNRDFDDALLELYDIVQNNGFYVLSAGAFVAQHSIFPKIAQGRPDDSDLMQAREFGANSIKAISITDHNTPLKIRGNHPYRAVKPIPLFPTTNSSCNACGLCFKQCPVQAIDANDARKIDKHKCISCAHCIYICPKHSKRFSGLLYWIASKKFAKYNRQQKEPYLLYR